MPEPLESFRMSNAPVAPRPDFARALRTALERAAATPERSVDMTTTITTTLTPYLAVHDAAAAIDFYVQAFGAVERYRLVGADGRVGHADLGIGDATLYLADEFPESGVRGPRAIGGSPVLLHLRVPDVDAAFERAVAAGATVVSPVENQFYGERGGTVADPFGYVWMLQTHIEDVSPDEMSRRWDDIQRGEEPD
jgi:PhnB protein